MSDTISTSYESKYNTNMEHPLDGTQILAAAKNSFESAAIKFSIDAISGANIRVRYINGIKRMSQMIQSEVDSGKISVRDGANFCNEMRNQILLETRKISSPQAKAYAELKKPNGPNLSESLDKYSVRLFKKPFSELTESEKDKASYAVIESSSRNQISISTATQRLRIAGKVGILITAAIAVHTILTANDKLSEAARQGTVIQGGVLGAYLAGLAVSSICGPGAPFCAIAVVIIGTTASSVVTESALDIYTDEIKEFRTWGIR